MRTHLRSFRSLAPAFSLLAAFLPALLALPAAGAPVKGFREDWPGTSLQGWGGGSEYDNPGTGGVDGVGDGFLVVSTPSPLNLGTFNFNDPYPGDWIGAGIQLVKVSLNDIGTDDPLSIHFSFTDGNSIWQCNRAFQPPHNQWSEFTVDVTQPSDFTRLVGFGGFAQTLSNVDRIHFRHDVPPYIHPPDAIKGDVGIDRLILTNASTPALATTWGRIKGLYSGR